MGYASVVPLLYSGKSRVNTYTQLYWGDPNSIRVKPNVVVDVWSIKPYLISHGAYKRIGDSGVTNLHKLMKGMQNGRK